MSSKRNIALTSLLFTLFCSLFALNSSPEIVDRIVAIVNEHVITLTDLQIAYTFGLFEQEQREKAENPLLFVLQRMVDQKVVIDATKEKAPLEEFELTAALEQVTGRFNSEELQKKLEKFDLSLEDLEVYLEEKILYHKILSRRFGKDVSVNLEDIETYYKETYAPSQEKKGLKPKPMLELLDEIELRIKQDKIKVQINDWINNLKEKAEVEIRFNTLMDIKKKEIHF